MNRPYIIINCAMSADGKTALPGGKQLRLSSEEDMARVYQLRHTCDAVLVGIGTVLADDPKLTVKEKYVSDPRQPLRVILDGGCRAPEDALVFNTAAETMVFTKTHCTYSFTKPHITIQSCSEDENGLLDLMVILDTLYEKGIRRLLVEGGGTIIWSFLSRYLFDELIIYIAPVIVGGKQTPTFADGKGISSPENVVSLELIETRPLGDGVLLQYKYNHMKKRDE